MANDFKYYGGDNQIARLPYKTIDALQQLGLYAIKDPDEGALNIYSDMQDIDPDYAAYLRAFSNIFCNYISSDTIESSNLIINGDSYNYTLVQKVKILANLSSVSGKFTTNEINKLRAIGQSTGVCLLYDNNKNIVLLRQIDVSSSGISRAYGYIFTSGSSSGVTRIGQWKSENGISWTCDPVHLQQQYLHMINFTTPEGDTVYLTVKSGRSPAATNYTQVKMAIVGGLSNAKDLTAPISCSGFNAGKVIVAINLQSNIVYYADGTNATFTNPTTINDTTLAVEL